MMPQAQSRAPQLEEHFASALITLLPQELPHKIAVAVSGGADSMCLSLLLHQWAEPLGIRVIGLTVDHLLRPESTDEAHQVHKWLATLGIEHHILSWDKEQKPRNLQESARQARYGLLDDWCQENDVRYLALAHNQDDQIETLLQRFAHHSGPLGLAGIPNLRELKKITLIRPLLAVSKKDIKTYLQQRHQNWIDDPSNQNVNFMRVKIRQSKIAQDTQIKKRLLELRSQLARQRMALETEAKKFCDINLQIYPEGFAYLQRNQFSQIPKELQILVLSSVLQLISGKEYPLGADQLHSLQVKLERGKKINSHGCILWPQKKTILICREADNIKESAFLKPGETILWDQRYKVITPQNLKKGSYIAKIGAHWKDLHENEKIMQLPEPVRPTIPGIWRKERLISIPDLSYDDTLEDISDCKLLYYPTLQLCRSRFI